ncbi:DeoR/GlpR family DNA-binding transcription regulator [Salinispirillum marinum]|uniref:DeoR/GlpR family DNA-binding transcription regulator n=2 Tax=Saccharospirillaceae TaxID=255527 RepID=A0ABV8BDM0_9GAMM
MNQRQYEIVQRVNQLGKTSVMDVAKHFDVSVQTVRSDIRYLAERGLILRNHGEVLPFPHRENISYDQRRIRNLHGKERMAALCAGKISDYQSLFMGTGSSVAEVANHLTHFVGLKVMTNNLHVVSNLCSHQDCEITVAGGRVRKRDQDVVGGDAVKFFERYRADVGMFSVAAINRRGVLFDFTDEDIDSLDSLVLNSHYRILLADNTKFESESRCVWDNLSKCHCLITDSKPPKYLLNKLSAAGVEVLY